MNYDLFFNPKKEINQTQHNLPHWQQGEAWIFVTWRLWDAMPHTLLKQWHADKTIWLDAHPQPWDEKTEHDYHDRFSKQIEEWLDAGHGSCLLKNPPHAQIVNDALRHFDGIRYCLDTYVVMPNHVHVLFRPSETQPLHKIIHTWKSFTAKEINFAMGRTGSIWQNEYWDRIIRNERHRQATRQYIMENPSKLAKGTFILAKGLSVD
jgi:type I restriction enzyme R subunit